MAQQQIIELLADIAQVCRQAPTDTMIAAYARAARQFCLGSGWLRASIDGATVAGTRIYSLGSDPFAEIFGVAGVTLYESATEPQTLTESASGRWDPTADQDVPSEFQYLPEAQIALYPTPDAAYDMTVGALVAPKRGVNSIDASLVVKWEYPLQEGALAYLLALPDVPWANPQLAQMHDARFAAAIIEAANSAARGFNPGATPMRVQPA